MLSLEPPRRPPAAASLFAVAAAILLASPAAARELEPGATLEGFPSFTFAAVAMTADGLDLYASTWDNNSTVPTAGLAWLRRDPASGKLQLRRNYFSEGRNPAVYGSALSENDAYLLVLKENRVESHLRGADGSLAYVAEAALPANFRPQAIHRVPHGGFYVVGTGVSRIYGLDAGGHPVLRQTLDGAPAGRRLAVADDGLFITGSAAMTWQGGSWTWQPLANVTSAITSVGLAASSPDRRYLYVHSVSGVFPMIGYAFVTLEKIGDQLVEVGRSPSPQNFSHLASSAAVHPLTGHLYVGAFNDDGGSYGTIVHYLPADGGRRFVESERITDPYDEVGIEMSKGSLVPSPDGRHLYASFDSEPMALLEIGSQDGKLTHVPAAAGLHSYFQRPVAVQSVSPRDLYFTTPNAILHARRVGAGGLELVSSLRTGSPPKLALAPGGGAAAVALGGDVLLAERNPNTGRLRLLPETAVRVGYQVNDLVYDWGDHLYAVSFGDTTLLEADREAPGLTVKQVFPEGGDGLRVGPRDAFLLRTGDDPLFLELDPSTGELAADNFCCGFFLDGVTDVRYARGGGMLYLFHADSYRPDGVAVFKRESFHWSLIDEFEAAAPSPGNQAVSEDGLELYRLDEQELTLEGWVTRGLAHQVEPLARLDRDQLGGVGARRGPYGSGPTGPLALLQGSNELVVANEASGNLRLFRRGCGKLEAGPCLAGQRFRVRVTYFDQPRFFDWPAQASPVGSAEAQVFTFFDSTNWEMMVKVLDGCGINDRFWVYAAASTDVGFEIEVTDTWTGQQKQYYSPAGAPAPAITDGAAFATCAAEDPGWSPVPPTRPELVQRPEALELGPKFRASASWTVGPSNRGNAVGLRTEEAQASGLFYFFSPDNWELQVKVLDGCALNGYHWVFGAATTDVGYELVVTENATGRVKRYTNPLGQASKAITDIQAFSCN